MPQRLNKVDVLSEDVRLNQLRCLDCFAVSVVNNFVPSINFRRGTDAARTLLVREGFVLVRLQNEFVPLDELLHLHLYLNGNAMHFAGNFTRRLTRRVRVERV